MRCRLTGLLLLRYVVISPALALTADPFELMSQHNIAPPERLKALSLRLAELAVCAGDTCREPTEDVPRVPVAGPRPLGRD